MAVHNERIPKELGPQSANIAAGTGIAFSWRVPGPTGAKYRIDRVDAIVDADHTANGTNYTVWTLRNVTTSTDITSRSYITGNSVANTHEALTVAAAAAEVTAGDVITWTKVETGTGLASRLRAQLELVRIK